MQLAVQMVRDIKYTSLASLLRCLLHARYASILHHVFVALMDFIHVTLQDVVLRELMCT